MLHGSFETEVIIMGRKNLGGLDIPNTQNRFLRHQIINLVTLTPRKFIMQEVISTKGKIQVTTWKKI